MQIWTARYLPWLLVLGLLFASALLHARTAFASALPEDAVRVVIEAEGQRYAGDCAATVSPRDVGAVCSRLVGEREDGRAYLTGRTFSEFSRWLFVASDGRRWHVVGEAPLDFHSPSLDVPWPSFP